MMNPHEFLSGLEIGMNSQEMIASDSFSGTVPQCSSSHCCVCSSVENAVAQLSFAVLIDEPYIFL